MTGVFDVYPDPARSPTSGRYMARPRVALSRAETRLLDQLSGEISRATVCCVQFASLFNATAYVRSLVLPADIQQKAEGTRISFTADDARPLLAYLQGAFRPELSACLEYLALMRAGVPGLLSRQAATGRITREDVAAIREITQTAACFAKLTLKDLIRLHESLPERSEAAQMRYLVALIDDVLEGRSSLFADGRMTPARNDFSGRDERIAINADAIVTEPSGRERVVVSDISRGGLAFEGHRSYTTGQKIQIHIISTGRALHGEIVWQARSKAGIAFHDPLDPSDELLRSAV